MSWIFTFTSCVVPFALTSTVMVLLDKVRTNTCTSWLPAAVLVLPDACVASLLSTIMSLRFSATISSLRLPFVFFCISVATSLLICCSVRLFGPPICFDTLRPSSSMTCLNSLRFIRSNFPLLRLVLQLRFQGGQFHTWSDLHRCTLRSPVVEMERGEMEPLLLRSMLPVEVLRCSRCVVGSKLGNCACDPAQRAPASSPIPQHIVRTSNFWSV